ncbi:MAG: ABC transporter ATP-binding protein [Ignavibacteriae bacterium]|nr:ABC transporter ATP-binding protein [Ignavibacteriota bacterium]
MNELRFDSLTKRFDERVVLENVSGRIQTGIIGVLGTNGAGKTTLIRILAGLLPPQRGEFLFNGEKLNLESQFWRENIGYLPQSPGLYERMTVGEYLDYMLLLSGWKRRSARGERIEEVTANLNLQSYKNTPIGHLSGGTKQRAAIAQAVIHKPTVLFLDEPTNNLDSEERHRFHDYLLKRADEGIVLFIGHIVNELAGLCSTLMIVGDEKIQFQGTPAELIASAQQCVKEVRMQRQEFTDELKQKLRILNIAQDGKELLVRFDGRFSDIHGSNHVEPTLEEAYRVFGNSGSNAKQ